MRFIESILFENGVYHNLWLHQERFNQTLQKHLPSAKSYSINEILPTLKVDGRHKVRMVYELTNEGVTYHIEYSEYLPRRVKTLEIIDSVDFDYSFKYANRDHIKRLLAETAADDIIISIDDKITDSSYSNLAFWDGEQWITPSTPLLNGVRRQLLLNQKRITEVPIKVSDLVAFEKVSLINAMLDLGEVEVLISCLLKS